MVPVVKLLADVFQGELGHVPGEVDGDVPGPAGGLGPALAPDGGGVDVVELAHLFDDDFGGGEDVGGLLKHVPHRPGDGAGVYVVAQEIPEGQDFLDGALDLPDVGGDVLRHVDEDFLRQLHPHADGLVLDDGHAGLVVRGLDVCQQAPFEAGF